MAIVFLCSKKEQKPLQTDVASGIDAVGNVEIEGIDVTDKTDGKARVASDLKTTDGDVKISEIKVRRGK